MESFCSGVYGARYRVLVWGRTYAGGEQWDFDIIESPTELCVVRGGIREDKGDSDGMPILVDTVLMDGQQRRGDLDNDVDAEEYPFGFELLPGGLDRQFGSAAQWCYCCRRNSGRTSASQWPGILNRTFRLESAE